MKTRIIILSIVMVLATIISFNAYAQTPEKVMPKATIDGKWKLETVGSPMGDTKIDMTITKTKDGYIANMQGYSISDVKVTDTTFMCMLSAMGMMVEVDLYLTSKGTLEGCSMGVDIVGTKE